MNKSRFPGEGDSKERSARRKVILRSLSFSCGAEVNTWGLQGRSILHMIRCYNAVTGEMVRSEGGAVSVRWRNQEALRRAWGCPWVGHGREQQRHKDRGTEGSVPGSRGPVWLRKEVGRGGQANVASSPGSRPAGGGRGWRQTAAAQEVWAGRTRHRLPCSPQWGRRPAWAGTCLRVLTFLGMWQMKVRQIILVPR